MTRLDSTYKNNCSKRSDNYSTEEINIFISKDKCAAGKPCNGSKEYPFDEVNKAFWNAHLKSNQRNFAAVNIYFLAGPHYILRRNLPQVPCAYFRRVNASIKIKPCFCSFPNITGCVPDATAVEISIKTDGFNIFIANSLIISDIKFNGRDLHLATTSEENNLTNCYNLEQNCCPEYNISLSYSSKNPCGLSKKIIYLTSLERWDYRYGFLNLEPILDDPQLLIPNLTLLKTSFTDIYSSKSNNTWISLIYFPSNVRGMLSISSVNVSNILLIKGIVFSKELAYLNPLTREAIVLMSYMNLRINVDNLLIEKVNKYNVTLNTLAIPEVGIFFFDSFQGSFIFSESKISDCRNYNSQITFFSLNNTPTFVIRNVFFTSVSNFFIAYIVNSSISLEKTTFTDIKFYSFGINLTFAEIIFKDCIFMNVKAASYSFYFFNSNSVYLKLENIIISSSQINFFDYYSNFKFKKISFNDFLFLNHFLWTYSTVLQMENFELRNLLLNRTFSQLNNGEFKIKDLDVVNVSYIQDNFINEFFYYFFSRPIDSSITNLRIDSLSGVSDFVILSFLGSDSDMKLSFISVFVSNSTISKIFQFIQIPSIIIENVQISNSNYDYNFGSGLTLFDATYLKTLRISNISVLNIDIGNESLINIAFCWKTNQCDLFLNSLNFCNITRANRDLISLQIPNVGLNNLTIFSLKFLSNESSEAGRLINFKMAKNLTIDSVSIIIFAEPIACVFEMYDTEEINITNVLVQNIAQLESKLFYISVISSRGGSKFLLRNIKLINLKGRSSDLKTKYNSFISFFGLETDAVKIDNEIQLISSNISFYDTGDWSTGAVCFTNIKNITLSNYTFRNTSNKKGGGIYVLRVTEVNIKFFEFQSCMAEVGGCLFLGEVNKLELSYIRIRESIAKFEGGVFYIENIELAYLEDVKIESTYAGIRAGVFYINKANTNISRISIVNTTTSDEGGAIFHTAGSLAIRNGTFSNLFSKSGGFASVQLSSSLRLENTQISNVYFAEKGISLSIFDVFDINFENLQIIKAIGGKFSKGNIFIESSGESITSNIKNFTCCENDIFLGSCIYYIAAGFLSMFNGKFSSNIGNILQVIPKKDCHVALINIHITFSISSRTGMLSLGYFKKVTLTIGGKNYFSNNRAGLLMQFESGNLSIANTTLKNNTADSPKVDFVLFVIKMSNVNFTTVEFRNELADRQISFMNVSESGFFINELIVSNFLTNYVILAQNSNGSITGSTFENILGLANGAIHLISSNLSIISSILKNNTLAKNSMPKLPEIDVTLSSKDLRAADIFSESFFLFHIALNIRNCSFESIGPAIIAYKIITIDIDMSLFRGYLGPEVLVYSCNLSIKRTNFQNLKNTEGAAVTIYNFYSVNQRINQFSVTSSEFFNNTAEFGGAILIRGYVNSSINNSYFINNKALATGGVLYLTCEQCSDLALIVNNCTFLSNRAENFAPTIFSQALTVCDADCFKESNKFVNNSDNMSLTENFFSFPLRVAITDILHSDNYEKYEGFESQNIIISGRKFSLKFAVKDEFNQTLLFDDDSRSTLIKGNNKSNEQIVGGFGVSKNGIHELKDVIVLSKPNSNVSLLVVIKIDEAKLFKATKEFNTLKNITYDLDFFSRPCVVGEIFIKANLSCLKCRPKEFSLIDPMVPESDDACKQCPANAKCRGGSDISPVYGYWRAHNQSSMIIPCLGYDFCLGGEGELLTDQEKINGKCLIHHSGTMCYTCEKGYARLGSKSICEECRSSAFLIFKFIITILALLAFALIQVNLNFTTENKSGIGILLKLILNHFQLLQMVSVIDMGWTPDILEYFRLQEYVTFLSEEMVSLDCILSNLDRNLLTMRVVATNSLPLILAMLMIMTLYIKIRFSFKLKGESSREISIKLYFKSSVVVIAYLFLPEILRKSFSLLNCMRIDDTSFTEVVTLSPDLICWERAHLENFYTVFLPGIAFWGVLLPISSLVLLVLNRSGIEKSINNRKSTLNIKDFRCGKTFALSEKIWNQHYTPENNIENSVHDKNMIKRKKLLFILPVSQPNVTLAIDKKSPPKVTASKKSEDSAPIIMKFLYRGYKSKCFYWEFVIYLKKLFMIMISSYSGMISREGKSTLVLVVVSLFLLAQTRVRPFESPELNNIEYFSLLAIFLTANVGMVLFSQTVKEHSTALLGILIFVNSAYLIYFLIILIKEVSKFSWMKHKPKVL